MTITFGDLTTKIMFVPGGDPLGAPTAAGTATWAHTVTAVSGKVLGLIVTLNVEGNHSDIANTSYAGVTYGGVSMTFIGRGKGNDTTGGNCCDVELYYLANPPVGTANVVCQINPLANPATAYNAFTGQSMTVASDTSLSYEGTATLGTDVVTTSVTTNITTTGPNRTIFSVFGSNREDLISPGSGETTIQYAVANQNGAAAGTSSLTSYKAAPTAGANSMTVTGPISWSRYGHVVTAFYESAVVTDGLTITDLAAKRVIQRTSKAAGTGTVPVTATFTGTTPTTLEARVMQGATVIQNWTAVTSQSIVGSTISGTLTGIPQGGGYTLETRTKNGGGTVLATSVGTNTWGIGRNIAIFGSSTPEKWFTDATAESPNALVSKYDESGWATLAGAGAVAFANVAVGDEPNVPIGMLDFGQGGSTLAQWAAEGSNYALLIAGIAAVGCELGLVHVGSNDARGEAIVSQAGHETSYRALLADIRSDTGKANLPIGIMGCQRAPSEPSTSDQQWTWARAAEMNVADDTDNFLASTVIDLPMSTDNVHLSDTSTGGNATSARRAARAVNNAVYGASPSYRGPRVASFTYNATTGWAIVTYTRPGGTGLVGRTSQSGITGLVFKAAGTPVTPITAPFVASATTVAAKLATGLSTVTLEVLYGTVPDVTNDLFDNAS